MLPVPLYNKVLAGTKRALGVRVYKHKWSQQQRQLCMSILSLSQLRSQLLAGSHRRERRKHSLYPSADMAAPVMIILGNSVTVMDNNKAVCMLLGATAVSASGDLFVTVARSAA